jgi:hypothetical protein
MPAVEIAAEVARALLEGAFHVVGDFPARIILNRLFGVRKSRLTDENMGCGLNLAALAISLLFWAGLLLGGYMLYIILRAG